MPDDAWQQSKPCLHDRGHTVLSGASFPLTDAVGDMRAERHGFFVADRRVLQRLRVRVPDHDEVALRAGLHDDDEAQVVRRLQPHRGAPGLPPLLLSTTLLVPAKSSGEAHVVGLPENFEVLRRPLFVD